MPAMKKNMFTTTPQTIGVIDSGVGGLSILNNLIDRYSNHDFVYVADAAHVPYGQKTHAYLLERATRITRFLQEKNISTIVVACHTLSATVLPELQALFPEMKYVDMVPPTISKALEVTKNNRIGVMATNATIERSLHKKLLETADNKVMVYEQACPLFVDLIEKQACTEELNYAINLYLQPLLKNNIDTIILGCTHYPFIQDLLQKKAPYITFVNAADTAQLESFSKYSEIKTPLINFITSASTDYLEKAVARYFKSSKKYKIQYTACAL